MSFVLEPSGAGRLCPGPIVLIIMDGVAVGPPDADNAVHLAYTPTLDTLREGLSTQLLAHGTAVGMPSDEDMGNSEVGHNALGAGRVFAQGAKLVEDAIQSGGIFQGETWKSAIKQGREGALHLIGLLSDGNVHSHERHLHAMIQEAASAGVTSLFVHAMTDGRDVSECSALIYVERLEALLATCQERAGDGACYRIASGGGRMVITMDRYEAEWAMVERGWNAHVHGQARQFASVQEAIETYREELGVNDQYLPAFVIAADGQPVGPIQDGDAVLLFNFRGDRAIEICRAFDEDDFGASTEGSCYFDRGKRPDVFFAGMMQYDGDRQIPRRYLVTPPAIQRTLSEYLVHQNIRQFAISETQKYGHITYFWNGNRSSKFDERSETYIEIPSDPFPFEQRPWMKAAEITDRTIEALRSEQFDFLRLNLANGDMVGHTGSLEATVIAVASVDLCVSRLLEEVRRLDGVLIVTADHGNADEMWERDKAGGWKYNAKGQHIPKTSHSLRPVSFSIDCSRASQIQMTPPANAGLSHVASTILALLGFNAPADYDPALIRITPPVG